jgi:hypothetical protein
VSVTIPGCGCVGNSGTIAYVPPPPIDCVIEILIDSKSGANELWTGEIIYTFNNVIDRPVKINGPILLWLSDGASETTSDNLSPDMEQGPVVLVSAGKIIMRKKNSWI